MGEVTSVALPQCLGVLLVKVGKHCRMAASSVHLLYIDAVFDDMVEERNRRLNPLPFVGRISLPRAPLGYGVLKACPECYLLIVRDRCGPVSEEMLLYIVEQADVLVRGVAVLLENVIAEAM